MIFAIFFVSLVVFVQTVAYARYEIQNNQNKIGGIFLLLLSIFILIAPTVLFYIH